MTTPVRPESRILDVGGGPTIVSARSTDEVVLAVQNALHTNTPVRIVAGGTWLAGGCPVRAPIQLNIRDLSGIVDYSPGDFTLTARAATPLSVIAAATAEHGQWLPLDPFGSPNGTLGATLATASAGPLAMSMGLPRDNVLGIEAVTGDARIIRGGGKVVKNVAGFDLVRLNIGAWGTLGILTEATVRTRALPEVDRTLLIDLPADTPDTAWWNALRALPPVVVACEAFSGRLASQLEFSNLPCAALRLCGNSMDVAAVESLLRDLGTPCDAPRNLWFDVRSCEPTDARIVRYSALPSHFGQLWARVAASAHGRSAHATVTRGIIRCFADSPLAELPDVSSLLFNVGTRVEQGDHTRRTQSPAAARALMSRVHQAFDPQRLLNPGIMDLS